MANSKRLSLNLSSSSRGTEEDLEENVCETMSSPFFYQTKTSGDLDIKHPWNDAKPQTEEAPFLCSGSALYSIFKTWISNGKVDVQKLLSDLPLFLHEMKEKYTPCSELDKQEGKKKQSDAPSTQEQFNASAFEKKSTIQSTQHKLLLSDDYLDIALPDKWDKNNNKSIEFKDFLNRYDRHVFILSYSRANYALLDWSNAGVNLESTLQILVVRPSDFNVYREWHGGRFPILRLPREETGLGYARHWIQKIATHLGLLHIWMIDDNVQCFYEVKPSSKSDGEGAGQDVRQSDGTMKPKAITFKGSCERKFEAVFSEIEKHVKNVPNLVAISPAVFRDGKVDRKAGPFIRSPPRAVVFLDMEQINQKRVSYRPQLTSFEDILFGAECENKGLKVLVWNRIHLYNKQLEHTGAHSPSKAAYVDCVEIEETTRTVPSLDLHNYQTSASGRTEAISPVLNDALKRVDYVKGFGIGEEKLVIHVLEGHEKETTNWIDKILKEHQFDGEHLVRTFYETDHFEFHSGKTVGGHRLDVSCFGTIGCFLQSKGVENQEIKRYAVTCHHVAKPGKMQEFGLLDRQLPADIALIPVERLSQAYQFEQGKCIQLEVNNPSDLKKDEVVKFGAATKLTRGKIVYRSYQAKVDGENFENVIVIENSDDYNQPFSDDGDSGSLVTLAAGKDEETPEVVSMLFAGGELEKRKRSVIFAFGKAINKLKQKFEIEDDFEIVLSKLPGKTV